tara:strand:- start:224 stop:442 length:219 start_codon:yes stop_codon:yes gene_type:complete
MMQLSSVMTLKPETIDDLSIGGGVFTSVWNFIIGGDLNMIIAALVGTLSIVVLFQRYKINRREITALDKKKK